MWGKRFVVSVGVMAMVLVMVAGCGRPATPKKNPAQESAVAFYKAFRFARDFEAVWDMALPGTFPEYRTKAEFVERWGRLELSQRQESPLQINEYERVEDRLYLVSTSEEQMLIWVTETPDGWKVRKYERYYGGPIPW